MISLAKGINEGVEPNLEQTGKLVQIVLKFSLSHYFTYSIYLLL